MPESPWGAAFRRRYVRPAAGVELVRASPCSRCGVAQDVTQHDAGVPEPRGTIMKAVTWAGALGLVVGCASADSMSSMRAETGAPHEGSLSVADCERFCGPQTPIADDNWCRCESAVPSSPAVRRALYQPPAPKRVTPGATCASQADCNGAHESCVRSDPTSATGQCQSVRVPRNENRHARVKPSG
jgi:hypothetical protein